jgi:hypothetical protein
MPRKSVNRPAERANTILAEAKLPTLRRENRNAAAREVVIATFAIIAALILVGILLYPIVARYPLDTTPGKTASFDMYEMSRAATWLSENNGGLVVAFDTPAAQALVNNKDFRAFATKSHFLTEFEKSLSHKISFRVDPSLIGCRLRAVPTGRPFLWITYPKNLYFNSVDLSGRVIYSENEKEPPTDAK